MLRLRNAQSLSLSPFFAQLVSLCLSLFQSDDGRVRTAASTTLCSLALHHTKHALGVGGEGGTAAVLACRRFPSEVFKHASAMGAPSDCFVHHLTYFASGSGSASGWQVMKSRLACCPGFSQPASEQASQPAGQLAHSLPDLFCVKRALTDDTLGC